MEIISYRKVHYKEICDIYNYHIAETVVTFEMEELSVEDCGEALYRVLPRQLAQKG